MHTYKYIRLQYIKIANESNVAHDQARHLSMCIIICIDAQYRGNFGLMIACASPMSSGCCYFQEVKTSSSEAVDYQLHFCFTLRVRLMMQFQDHFLLHVPANVCVVTFMTWDLGTYFDSLINRPTCLLCGRGDIVILIPMQINKVNVKKSK